MLERNNYSMFSHQKRLVLQIITTILMFVIFIISIQAVVHFGKELSVPIIINAVIGIMSLIGLVILYLVNIIGNSPDQTSSKLFGAMILTAYVGAFCDNLSWMLDGRWEFRLLNYFMNCFAFLVMPVSLIIFWNYQQYIFIGQSKTENWVKRAVNFGALIDVVFILIGTYTGFLFSIDQNNYYKSGEGLNLVYVYPFFLIGSCIFENLQKKVPLSKKISLLSFGLIPIITIVSLIIFPEYSFLYAMYFLDLVLIYGTVENKRHIESLEKSAMIAKQNQALLEQQTQIMISQIQPHFLYNTLTAIYQLCDIDTKLAQKMIQNFSSYLRANMDGIRSKEPILFEKELTHTKTYLEIELLRFSDILEVEYQIEDTDFEIPALSLQPLVENAVKYGIRSREDGGKITIATKRIDGKMYVSVHDDGMGFNPDEKKNDGKSHTGIENTRKRLKLMMDADLVIESQIGVGTTATIILKEKMNESVIGR